MGTLKPLTIEDMALAYEAHYNYPPHDKKLLWLFANQLKEQGAVIEIEDLWYHVVDCVYHLNNCLELEV